MRMLKAAVIVGLTLVSGVAMAQTAPPPPPPGSEPPPPPPPGPPARFYLAPGFYQWVGGAYVWQPQHWIPVRAGFHWVPPHWGPGRFGRWHFIPGHWAR